MLVAGARAQVSLYTAVDLALRNSTAVRMATADVQRAASALSESRDAYVPSFVIGSGLGYSYGFPVGQPSVYNVTSQSLLLGFSQPDYIRSAKSALKAGELLERINMLIAFANGFGGWMKISLQGIM